MSSTSRAVSTLIGVALAGIVGLQAESMPPATAGRGAVRPVSGHARAQASPAASQAAESPKLDRAILDKYCVTCHNDKLKTAGLTLDKIDVNQVVANAEVLEKVAHKLRTGQMPPQGRPRPEKAEAEGFAASLETALDRAAAATPNPGRLPVHRLNRVEYVNVIKDLLALDIDGPALLPADTAGLGFDNNADVLGVTPALMARYMSAATKVSRLAVGDPGIRPVIQVYRASEFATQDVRMGEDLPFGTHGGLAIRHAFPLDGEYTIRLKMQRNLVGNTIRGIDDQHEIELRVDRALLKRYKVGGKYKGSDAGILIAIPEDEVEAQKLHSYRLDADKDLELKVTVKAGTRLVSAAFTDSAPSAWEGVPLRPRSIKAAVFSDDAGDPGIDSIEISGPYNAKAPDETASRRQIFVCRPAGARDEEPCARRLLTTLARRAYRRPVTEFDLRPLMNLYKVGRQESDFDGGVERALEALLSSPAFLFRIERDPASAKAGTNYRLSDLELASRLSFFLWKSIPDDELLDAAAKGRLKDQAVLAQQVKRMLADQRSTRWMNDFVGQWLLTRNISTKEPDPTIFPDFDDNLREAMEKETQLFFESQIRDDHSLLDLLRANYTFVNARLAEHYGIPNVYGSHFRRVPVTDPARQGLLGQASVLTVTSYENRTSVVLRGKWVLENLLGAPPPPPPPNVPPLKENDGKSPPKSLRERMENHRRNPVCAACHSRMDPMGFALENFDAVGKWRDTDSGLPIDPVSTLADGTKIDSPKGFREVLLKRSDEFVQTVVEKLLQYALGRGVEYYDEPTVRQLVRDAKQNDYEWSALLLDIVSSKPFQMRRVPAADKPAAAPTTVAQGQ